MFLHIAAVAFILFLRRMVRFYRVITSVMFLPGYRTLLSTLAPFTVNALPSISGITPGGNFLFSHKHKSFESFGWDIYSFVSFLPVGVSLILADAAAIKEVTTSRTRFIKPTEMYLSLALYGPNVLVTEGEKWKKYKKIAAPAFSEPSNKLAWNETIRAIDSLLDTMWANKDEVSVDSCLDELALPLTLYIIGAAGFGRRISWVEHLAVPPGHKMSFKEVFHTLSLGIIKKMVFPSFIMRMFSSLRTIDLAFDELRVYMKEIIRDRQASEKVERHDLLSSLLETNDVGEGVLTDDELMGNVFLFLLAGHETASNTVCFAFALLALYPEIQEQLFKHVHSVVPEGTSPTYDQMPRLNFALAVVYEALRMFPPVPAIPKESGEDTSLVTSNLRGEKFTVPVPKGTLIMISTPGLHYNPRYWKDPYEFNPSRFLGEWDHDAFQAFSAGTRACLGRRFIETEIVAIICVIISHYKVYIKDEPQFRGESFEEKKERVLQTRQGLSLTPIRVPLTFKRRH